MILYPDKFNKYKPSGFDGEFNWEWMKGCFGETKIMPMDFDAVIERFGHYLICETKDVGVEIPQGQIITLDNLRNAKTFTVIKIWGKLNPEHYEIINPFGRVRHGKGLVELREVIKKWFFWANKKGDISRLRE